MKNLGISDCPAFKKEDSKGYIDEQVFDLQPNPAIGKDATIYNTSPNNNMGANESIWVGEHNALALIYRALIQFDLSTLPDNAYITSCRFHVHIRSNYANNIRKFRIYRMKRAWLEGTGVDAVTGDGATWNTYDGVNNWTAPGAFDPADCEQVAIAESNNIPVNPLVTFTVVEFTFNVTSKTALDLGFGWLIKADTEANDAHRFYSSDYVATPEIRPGLFITYIPVGAGTKYSFSRHIENPQMESTYGSIWYNGVGDWYHYYTDLTNVNRALSVDGINWTPDVANNPVMTPLPGGNIQLSMVFRDAGTWYMLYRSDEWGLGYITIGLATSVDGITWVKEATNPVITWGGLGAWDHASLDPWGIMKIGATYYLWYNTVGVTPRQSGLATSNDLITWVKDVNNPIFLQHFCIHPFWYNGYYYMVAPQDISLYTPVALNHLCEVFRDTDPRFLPGSRVSLGTRFWTGGGKGSFDAAYIDTPSIVTNDINRNSFPTAELWCYINGLERQRWFEGLYTLPFAILDDLP